MTRDNGLPQTMNDQVEDPWVGVNVDLVALQSVVFHVLCVSTIQCTPPVSNSKQSTLVFTFQLPSRTVVAHVVAPVKPLFKTDFLQVSEIMIIINDRIGRTSLPVPTVYAHYSEISSVDDYDLLAKPRSLCWVPSSPGSLRMLKGHCNHQDTAEGLRQWEAER